MLEIVKQVFNCSVIFLMFVSTIPVLAQSKPNVILILADDQGWGDLSIHGNPYVETPHLDGLAKDGKRADNFYVSPLCAPSRASILTGRYSLKTSVVSVSKGLEVMDTEETTLAELFKANGYQTGIFGKWHNGQHYPNRPNDQGFDEFLGFCGGHWSNYFDTQLDHNGTLVKTKGYITDVLTDAALQFIASHQQKPFFCYIPYNAPHSPHQVPDAYFNKYKAKGLDNELASIYGMVENMDENIGQILSYLKNNKLEENTIVLFLSDNGPNGSRYNGVLKGTKGSVHEGGMKVPFFIQWKNHIPANTTVPTPIAHIDLYPTLLDMCKLTAIPGKAIDGQSFASLLMEPSTSSHSTNRTIFTHVNFMQLPVAPNPGGFRTDQYRFVFEKGEPELYDLQQDPGEKMNLAPQKPDLTSRYLQEYQDWFASSVAGLKLDRLLVLSAVGVELPAYEASMTEGIKFKEGHGWAHDWVEKWNSRSDSIYWLIDCQQPGKYLVEMDYLCKKSNVGSTIICSVGTTKKEVVIRESAESVQIPSPDRVLRKEAYEMSEWKRLKIGTFFIPKGRNTVRLKALKLAGQNVAELKGLRLKLVR